MPPRTRTGESCCGFMDRMGLLRLSLTQTSLVLAGLSIELFYVEEGSINDYALKFPVPVPADTHLLVFNWQNTRPQIPLSYRLETSVDDLDAMHLPKVDIPTRGE